MGLDAYAYFIKKEDVINDFEFKDCMEYDRQEDFYWRGHHALNQWMLRLWHSKQSDPDDNDPFFIRLYEDDIKNLKQDMYIDQENKHSLEPIFETDEIIIYEKVPLVTNFYEDYDSFMIRHEYDMEFIESAEQAINDGLAVYYCADW